MTLKTICLICVSIIAYTFIFSAFMCTDFDDYYEKWKYPWAEWVHYHINGPLSLLCVVALFVISIGSIYAK